MKLLSTATERHCKMPVAVAVAVAVVPAFAAGLLLLLLLLLSCCCCSCVLACGMAVCGVLCMWVRLVEHVRSCMCA